jgi:hypothetical protein
MKDLNDVAAKYAAGKTNEAIDKAIAQAYADGYRDGYKDREDEIPIDIRDNRTEYVDLGLPSGTLWAKDFEKEGESQSFLPYGIAETLNIPTVEQWEELIQFCKWHYEYENLNFSNFFNIAYCVGPNGNTIVFQKTGLEKLPEVITDEHESWFWLKDVEDSTDKNAVRIYNNDTQRKDTKTEKASQYSGYKLPVRLVR